ncbi:MAG: L-threonylcarbamoyladenylate synthase [Gammaproteobacteria bacterium]
MAQFFQVHPHNPQGRLISQAVVILRRGGVIVYPTDSCYALGCMPGNRDGIQRIIRMRRLDPLHHMTLLCRDLSHLGGMARVDNAAFRMLRSLTPGPYTFLLRASRSVPRRLVHPRHKTIGLRVPDHRIVLDLLESLGEPLLSTSLILPGQDLPETDPELIRERISDRVDLIIDGGHCGFELTTVIDLVGAAPELIRQGKGPVGRLITS